MAAGSWPALRWTLRTAQGAIVLGRRTAVMGVLNRTPDSFSDGGRFWDLDQACRRAEEMVREGADIIDVGGESTRPGASFVDDEEELRRVIPLIRELRGLPVPISVDTYKARVASAALEAGAGMINDVWGFQRDPDMAAVAAEAGCAVVLMHNQTGTEYRSLLPDIVDFLRKSVELAVRAGLPEEQIVVDPGIGFGKTAEQNLEVLRRLGELSVLGRPILVGTSRKSTIGKVLEAPVHDRLEGTAATVALAIGAGAHIVRVHDVKEMVRVARMADAIVHGWQEGANA